MMEPTYDRHRSRWSRSVANIAFGVVVVSLVGAAPGSAGESRESMAPPPSVKCKTTFKKATWKMTQVVGAKCPEVEKVLLAALKCPDDPGPCLPRYWSGNTEKRPWFFFKSRPGQEPSASFVAKKI